MSRRASTRQESPDPSPAVTASGSQPGAQGQSSSGAEAVSTSSASAGQSRVGTASAAQSYVGAASGSSAAYRPSQQAPSLVTLPTANAVARDYGAFIVPVDGAGAARARGVEPFQFLGRNGVSLGASDVLSALALPDFVRAGRARTASPAGDGDTDLGVLGEQVAIPEVGNGEALSFGELPLLALSLVLLSSLLLVAAVLPPTAVARAPVSEATFDRLRQPLALAAIGILLPVAFLTLVGALT